MFLLTLFLSTFLQLSVTLHTFFFTKTSIEYSTKDKKYQISISLYADDLDKALIAEGLPALHLHEKAETATANEIVHKYISQHLIIKHDGKSLPMTWIGMEKGEEPQVLWCYLDAPAPKFKKGQIWNTLLLPASESQKNIVTFVPQSNNSQYLLFQQDQMTLNINP
ncbi:MAG: DUF6702 family protein [Saprospiraceae bacterium]